MFFERHEGGEISLLVHPDISGTDVEDPQEFRELAKAAGMQVALYVLVSGRKISPRHFLGTGKLEEICDLVESEKVDVVLFNHTLSATQERNLEKKLNCKVIDRTGLILDIFAQRAQTHEGRLQVELAQLKHLSTRLVRGWTHLERQKGGIGLRGPGETQLETDRRLLQIRVKSIEKKLDKVLCQRKQSRAARARADIPLISLVGYTNAGKSTLFRKLTSSDALVADQLFATLDTTVRRYSLSSYGAVLFSDTVGFIRNLPHDLVKAFRATLEESINAELLLHVIDSSSERRDSTIEEVDRVLNQIGANHSLTLQVYNKIDLTKDVSPRIDYNEEGQPVRVWISAEEEIGLGLLKKAISELLSSQTVSGILCLPEKFGRLKARLYACKAVQSEIWTEGSWQLRVQIPEKELKNILRKENMTFTIHLKEKQSVISLIANTND